MLTEKDYCDYDTCVALEEFGFPIRRIKVKGEEKRVPILLYEAQKWLREEKGIIVDVFVDDDSDTPITYNVYKDKECIIHHHGKYFTIKDWNMALNEGIKEAIKLLKEEK